MTAGMQESEGIGRISVFLSIPLYTYSQHTILSNPPSLVINRRFILLLTFARLFYLGHNPSATREGGDAAA